MVFLSAGILLQNVFGSVREQAGMVQNYENLEINAVLDTVRNDLLSEDALLQDAGCIILLKTLQRLKQGDSKAEFIFARLSGDKKVINNAADIIDSRMLGWYNPETPEENNDDIKIYTPLFYILGKADDKYARGTLVRSFLYLQGRRDILNEIPMSEEVLAIALKRVDIIEEKLCCVYPGRDFVAQMLENDSRLGMLDMLNKFLMPNKKPGEKMKEKIKEFVTDCMKYGDSRNGWLIRIKAAKIAGMLVKNGENDLAKTIEDLSKNDPYYIHQFNAKTGYSMTALRYPVREISSKILLR
jgi:hypothetical protein